MIRHRPLSIRFDAFARLAWLVVASATAASAALAASEKEAELIALLRSDAPKGEKALACKRLAIYGSAEAVPELAKLLSDEQLASWSRIALEAIPGGEADEALRNAVPTLEGRLLVGVINSLGVRRDAASVEPLIQRLTDPDVEVASAAAVALGRIGNSAATDVLQQKLATVPVEVRSAVAEGLVLCAERAFDEGRAAEAVELYDLVRSSDVPRPRIREATRGAILARGEEGMELLVEQLNSPDNDLFQIGLSTAREFPGDKVDAVLAKEMERAVPVRAALLIHAMADRPQTVVLPAVLKAAEKGPQPVRLAAIGALARIGNVSCVSSLLQIALEQDETLQQAAKKTLGELPGEAVDQEIVKRLDGAKGNLYPLLLELVGQRRIEAIPQLLKALNHADAPVRKAALVSLGFTIPPDKLSILISQVVSPKHAEDATAAQEALKTAAVRMPDREACAAELAAALGRASTNKKVAILEILGAVGGNKALETLAVAAKDADPALQDVSSRLIGEWMTIDAAPVLRDLAAAAPSERFQIRSLRGFIRIARQFVMPEEKRFEMCRDAFELARQTNERKLVLELLKRYPHLETLKLAIRAAEEYDDLKDEATDSALLIGQKLGGQASEVKKLLSALNLSKVTLEIVKAEYGAGAAQKDVTDVLRKHAGEVQIITLPAESFNDAFGGDPAPGAVKRLKIQYRINGKDAETSIAENALIALPMPK